MDNYTQLSDRVTIDCRGICGCNYSYSGEKTKVVFRLQAADVSTRCRSVSQHPASRDARSPGDFQPLAPAPNIPHLIHRERILLQPCCASRRRLNFKRARTRSSLLTLGAKPKCSAMGVATSNSRCLASPGSAQSKNEHLLTQLDRMPMPPTCKSA